MDELELRDQEPDQQHYDERADPDPELDIGPYAATEGKEIPPDCPAPNRSAGRGHN
jgi:hypothetical protein